jgi:hypothetical protein
MKRFQFKESLKSPEEKQLRETLGLRRTQDQYLMSLGISSTIQTQLNPLKKIRTPEVG